MFVRLSSYVLNLQQTRFPLEEVWKEVAKDEKEEYHQTKQENRNFLHESSAESEKFCILREIFEIFFRDFIFPFLSLRISIRAFFSAEVAELRRKF